MFLQTKANTDKLMEFDSFAKVIKEKKSNSLVTIFTIALICSVVVLCLPWTQNIKSKGSVSTLSPNQRPQQINSIIAGRIEKWYIQDGQYVKKGDTLLRISEVKEDYLDESLLARVEDQIKAKTEAIDFYDQKANTAVRQQSALKLSLDFKLQQIQNKLKQFNLKVESDSIALIAATNQYKIAKEQLNRQKQMFDAGLKSLTDLEQKQQYLQDALSKKISAESKFFNTKNELLNIRLDLLAAQQEYSEKILKTAGDKFTALSQVSATEGEVAKLKNQYANYKKRQGFYIITAPQNGQVLRSVKAGIGETVKDGEPLMQIVPTEFEPAVEMFINPLDLSLINIGEKVQIQFDGFPAIVFSGWPEASYGIFEGKVVAIDQSINKNGQFRVWVSPGGKKPWPKEIRYGSGTKNITLLKNVPLGYELWRQINGFPPDFYESPKADKDEK
ncbi:HlyD family efflux transporter periplasmic adaptor subunit [Pedobacter sp. SD-b]|uniref:HlyD family efflux transporter periplasmic adaptor subunit n=1 Tax=Pedobacter segetis TaxID=2793069 RepID=A0ABS1BKG2_9SPHI|nr:HlyD family efflux transporter periplasmic adaptor subunit [Pedobacter segetis]MBK0383380.1 HlyD family efflux transporter periplasmic adaptor subunit [Pedobacter segetis]